MCKNASALMLRMAAMLARVLKHMTIWLWVMAFLDVATNVL